MNRRLSAVFLGIQLLVAGSASAQMHDYKYKRELKGINAQWHAIELPDDVFGKVNIVETIRDVPTKTDKAFSDVRIYGITKNNDTIEAPYILKTGNEEDLILPSVRLSLVNEVRKGNEYYFTLQAEEATTLNMLSLEFAQQNFDWRVQLEGSNDGNDWFTILQNERILSIKNQFTDYQFTSLYFQPVQYKYLRISIPSAVKPVLRSFHPQMRRFTKGNYHIYKPVIAHTGDKKTKTTNIQLSLDKKLPVSMVSVSVKDSFDYYRPVTIAYLSDSFETPKGWQYHYTNAYSGVLSSLEDAIFNLGNIYTQKLKIIIENHDNQPLHIDSIQVKGAKHELVARFTADAQYYLVYGNATKSAPNYDIPRFDENIPLSKTTIAVGPEEKIVQASATGKTRPLIENKLWLWAIMGAVILLLGWFTLKMMRTGESQS